LFPDVPFDLEAEGGDAVHLLRRRQHAHAPHAEVLEDLGPDPEGAQHRPLTLVRARGIRRRGGGERAQRLRELARRVLLAQHDDDAVARLDDALQGRPQRPRAQAPLDTDQVAQRVGEVHANERRLRAVEPAARESEVHLETGAVLVGIETELPELGLNALLEDALHRPLGAQPITDQVRDGADLELVAARELLQLRAASHDEVVVGYFAVYADGIMYRQSVA